MRHAEHVVDLEQASQLFGMYSPVSPELMMPFDQRKAASAQQQPTSTATGGNGDSAGGGSDDEVVEEGDYEVIDEEQEAPKA